MANQYRPINIPTDKIVVMLQSNFETFEKHSLSPDFFVRLKF